MSIKMFCRCGNKIEGQQERPDYCSKCNEIINETLDEIDLNLLKKELNKLYKPKE